MPAICNRLAEVYLSELVAVRAAGDRVASGLRLDAGPLTVPCLPCLMAAAVVAAGAAVLASAGGVVGAEARRLRIVSRGGP